MQQPEPVLQPLVRTNPDNGRKALYFHTSKTENIIGLTPQETQVLFDELLTYALKPEFIYSHTWRLGDMLLWDNRSALHKANYDYDPADVTQHRLLYRIMVKGERPV
jgi:taurine dioxygenase